MSAAISGEFTDVDSIEDAFEEPGALAGARVLLAWYTCADYEGHAFVLFERDGKVYEVNGSHCSCNGLEGQWAPEEASWAELANRVRVGTFAEELDPDSSAFLVALVDKHVPPSEPPQ